MILGQRRWIKIREKKEKRQRDKARGEIGQFGKKKRRGKQKCEGISYMGPLVRPVREMDPMGQLTQPQLIAGLNLIWMESI